MADTLPNNVDAEKSLLACLLIEPKDFVSICLSSKLVISTQKPIDISIKLLWNYIILIE